MNNENLMEIAREVAAYGVCDCDREARPDERCVYCMAVEATKNTPPVVLDKWDSQIISIWKRSKTDTLKKCLKVWGERVAMSEEYTNMIQYINQHFLCLAQKLGLFNNEYRFTDFINSLNPESNWKYGGDYLTRDTKDFQIILFSRLDSLYSLTEIKYLPGFVCDYSFDE